MRKNLFIALGAILLAAPSCSDLETEIKEQESSLVNMTFEATIPVTKTILGDQASADGSVTYPILWESGDALSVFDVNTTPKQDAKLLNQDETSAVSATFKGLVSPSETGYYALYPYQDTVLDDVSGLFDSDEDGVPESMEVSWCGYNQEATAFGYDPDKAFLAAYTDAGCSEFEFKHVFSYVKLSVTFDCESVIFESNDSEERISAQDITIKMADGVPTITSSTNPSHGQNRYAINLLSKSGDLPAGTYLIAVMPGTLAKGFKLTFKTSAYTWTKSTSKSVELERAQVLNLGSFSSEDFLGTSTGDWLGSGTESDPYQISTLAQWTLLAERMNGKYATYSKYRNCYFKLMNDLDFGGARVACVGCELERAFEGTFDGDNHTISNYIPSTVDCVEALFGYVKAPTIMDLTLKPLKFNCNYEGASDFSYSPLVGVCACPSDHSQRITMIRNCHVAPYAEGQTLQLSCGDMDCYYGSMIAWARGSFYCLGCDNSLNVTLSSSLDTWWQDYAAGGIVGRIIDYYLTSEVCTFDRCRNTGNIQVICSDDCMVGGILGGDYDHYNNDVTLRMTNCENRGRIFANAYDGTDSSTRYAGGLVGEHDSDGRLANDDVLDPFFYNCLNTGWIYCSGQENYAAGLTGYTYDDDSVFYSCVNTGAVTGNAVTRYFGNFCGVGEGVYVNCFYRPYTAKEPGYNSEAHFMYDIDFNDEIEGCCKDGDGEDIVGDDLSGDKLANMNSYLYAIPTHPDAAVVFASYGSGYEYVSWSGKASDGSLKIDF